MSALRTRRLRPIQTKVRTPTGSSLHAHARRLSSIRIETGGPHDTLSDIAPMRAVADSRLRLLNVASIKSTTGQVTKIRIHSCNKVNKLRAIDIEDLNTYRATIDCSKVIIDGVRTKRVSISECSLSGVHRLSMTVKRNDSLVRSTQRCTSTKVLDVRDHKVS